MAATAGLPPQRMALILAAGLVIGVFPVMGCPTAMCLVVAYALRTNPAPLLAVNHVASPLQIALVLPLARAGAWFCGAAPQRMTALRLAGVLAHAVAGWACVCVPLGVGAYFALLALLVRGKPGANRPEQAAPAHGRSRISSSICGISKTAWFRQAAARSR